MVDLNQVVIDGEAGLFAKLCALPDHRKAKGIRHQLASILVVCAVAMLAGNHNPTEIAKWAADLPDELRLRLHLRRSPSSGRLVAPSISTIQRALRNVDREALDKLVCETLADQVRARRATDNNNNNNHDAADDQATDPCRGGGNDDDRPSADQTGGNDDCEAEQAALSLKAQAELFRNSGRRQVAARCNPARRARRAPALGDGNHSACGWVERCG